jgi:tetratricopeptide (TPR) repeat protein
VDFGALIRDQRARWLRGEPVVVEDYLEKNPALRAREETILDLIYNEVVLREQVGQDPDLEEYQRRFPRWAPQLAAQFEAHRAQAESESTLSDSPGPVRDPANSTIADLADGPPATLMPDEATADFGRPPSLFPGLRARAAEAEKAPAPLPRIPGYEVLGELGRGGMGVVYLARQVRLNRPCALKTILAGDHASPEVALRFLAEAETVARLRHPNIVQIHAIGDYDNRPYIELEYIEGGSLAARLDGTPWAAERAARLIETVARAVHEAHTLGVVHRDLKPANVLMAGDEVPKLTDFGLAKSLHGDSGLTRTESILGSPSYMAPEQAGGRSKEVGTGADIYALGAILYELLTGRPPFRATTLLETLEQVRTSEAVPPSRLQPGLPRDLDTIALKCLEKEPERRYATARDLADDLGRYLRGETIHAQAVGPLERTWKWMKRRPLEAAFVAVASLALLAVTWALAASTYERNLASKNRALDQALADAQQQRARAKRGFDQAREVIDHFITLIEQRLDEPQLKAARDELLADGLAYYQNVLQQWDDTPELQFELIRTYAGAAQVADSLGSKSEALKAYQQALAMLERLVTRCPDVPEYRLELAEIHHRLGRFFADMGQVEPALKSYEAGRTIRETLRRERPRDPRVLTDLARSHGYIGDLLLSAGRLDEAQAAYLRSHEIRSSQAHEAPGDPVLRLQLSRSFTNLARLGRQNGRLDEAAGAYREAIALAEDLDAEQPGLREFRSDLAWDCGQLGSLLLEAVPPQAGEASKLFLRARDLYGRLIEKHPGIPEYRSGLGLSLLRLGQASAVLGHQAEALRSCREACDLFDRLVTENPRVIEYLYGLALSCDAVGECSAADGHDHDGAARGSCTRAQTLLEQLVRDDPGNIEYHSDLGHALSNLARTMAASDPAAAEATLNRAIDEQGKAIAKAPGVELYRRRLEADRAALGRWTKDASRK